MHLIFRMRRNLDVDYRILVYQVNRITVHSHRLDILLILQPDSFVIWMLMMVLNQNQKHQCYRWYYCPMEYLNKIKVCNRIRFHVMIVLIFQIMKIYNIIFTELGTLFIHNYIHGLISLLSQCIL